MLKDWKQQLNMRELTKGARHEASQATVQEVHRVSPRSWRSLAGSGSKNVFVMENLGTLIQIGRFQELACHRCDKIGHLAKICQSSNGDNRKTPRKKTVHHIKETVKDSPEDGDLYVIRCSPKLQPYKMDVEVNGKILQMDLDTGASLLLVSEGRIGQTWRYRRVTLHCSPTLVSPFQ